MGTEEQSNISNNNKNVSCLSPIDIIFRCLCKTSYWLSFLWLWRKSRFRYLFSDLFVLGWLLTSLAVFLWSSGKNSSVGLIIIAILLYRCGTLCLGHINILLYDSGKNTPARRKIHSRSRYLLLTALNYCEFLLWNSIVTVWLQPINSKASYYSEEFVSRLHVIYYNFVTCTTLGYGEITPKPYSYPAQYQTILGTAFSILMLAVVVNIVINIRKEDEYCTKYECRNE